MKKTRVPIKDLKFDLYVRQHLNQDHVLYLAGLIEGGKVLDPIMITEGMTVIDGRHRIEANLLLDHAEIDAEVYPFRDEVKIISEAYRSNIGGALPPTIADTEQTIMLLLERGEKQTSIAGHLKLPNSMIRKLVKNVQSKMARKKVQMAASAVTENGLTVTAAAEQFKVKLPQLKEFMSPTHGKKRGVPDLQRQVSSMFRSSSIKTSKFCVMLLDKFEDGDISREDLRSIFDQLQAANGKTARNISEYRARFDAKAKEELGSEPNTEKEEKE